MNHSFLSAGWKSALVISILLGASCHREQSRATGPRMTEPRLTGFDGWRRCTRSAVSGHVVEAADCGPSNLPPRAVSIAVSECEDSMKTETGTVRILAYYEQCTDAAVEKLEALAQADPGDAQRLSDLAAAYFIRAQRRDRPSDFVRALDTADRSVALDPSLSAARFNQALAQETLGFSLEATASWDALRKSPPSPWTTEAQEHYAQLVSATNRSEAFQWRHNKERLPLVAVLGDPRAVSQLVAPYPSSAQRYIEEYVLPAWANASATGKPDDAASQLRLAQMIAAALAEVTKDRFLLDAVERLRDPRATSQLERGLQALGTARLTQRADRTSAAALYHEAALALTAAGSPLRFQAMLGQANALALEKKYDESAALLPVVARAAREQHYPTLLARALAARSYLLMAQRRDIDAIAVYSEAQSAYESAHDMEGAASVRSNTIGLYRRIRHENLTWGAAYQTLKHIDDLGEAQTRHIYLGENALSATELGYPSVGLHYQDAAVRMLTDELSRIGNGDPTQLRRNLGIALRARAGIHLELRQQPAAESDLAESTRLLNDERSGTAIGTIPIAFRARMAELDAQRLAAMHRWPQAIERLTEAIQLSSVTVFQTLIASLRLQRAELYRLEGNRTAAAEDLKTAIGILRAEEKVALQANEGPTKTPVEELWSAYFSRSQEAYRRLIRLYVEDGADAEAFDYAEKGRAYEPLHLVLHRPDLPPAFRDRIHDGEPFHLVDVQQTLPAGVVLLQYSVLEQQTYVWIIGRDFSERRTLNAGEKAIREWTRKLQRMAEMRNGDRFDTVAALPYDGLFAEPLAIVEKLQRGAKLVIVPDGPMHGLPFSALRHNGKPLIADHAVSVAASATLYAFSVARDQQQTTEPEQTVLLFADPAFNEHLRVTYDLKKLDNARDEATRIRTVYAHGARPPLVGADATFPAFLHHAADSTIIHLAVHGVANPEVPPRSFLLLAPTGNDDQGVVDAERLLKHLQLKKAHLAVLSACSSAGGTPVGPEGLAPLVRPFVAAGVPGVVGTLWNVSDDVATEDLLVRFHELYRGGVDADEALRQAQLALMSDPKRKGQNIAWVWAAFQLYGRASSPFPASAGQ